MFKKATVEEWLDCGTLPAWLETTGEILKKEKHEYGSYEDTIIHPPVFIGEDVEISRSEIGPNVSIESGSTIQNSTIKNSIIQEQATIKNSDLEKSTIGKHAQTKRARGSFHIGDHSVVEQR